MAQVLLAMLLRLLRQRAQVALDGSEHRERGWVTLEQADDALMQ